MAKNKTATKAAKLDSKVKKEKVVTSSGKTLFIPAPTESQLPFGFRRITRSMSGERANEEIFWLLLETFLTEEELAAWDGVSSEEASEAMESKAAEDLGK